MPQTGRRVLLHHKQTAYGPTPPGEREGTTPGDSTSPEVAPRDQQKTRHQGPPRRALPKRATSDAGEVAPGSNRDSRKTHVTLGISLGRTTVQWSVLRMEQAKDKQKPGERRKRRGAPVGSRHQLKTTRRNQSQCHQLAGGCHSTGNQPRTGTGSGHSVGPTQATTNRHLAQGKDLRGKRPTLRNRLEVGGVCRAWDTRTMGSARRLRTSKNGQGAEIT